MAGSGRKGCACVWRAGRRGSWVERGGFPNIDHFRMGFWEGRLGCSAIYNGGTGD